MAVSRNGDPDMLKDIQGKAAGNSSSGSGKNGEDKKNKPLACFKNSINRMMGEIEAALPQHLKANAERYARNTLTLFSANPKLQACEMSSILGAMMTASALGLDLSPQLGQCYIIPYDGKAQFQFGYKGLVNLAYRSDKIAYISAMPVYEKDEFKYEYGTKKYRFLKHHPSPLPKVEDLEDPKGQSRGRVLYYYAIAELTNGGENFIVWPRCDIIAHAKKFSKNYYRYDKATRTRQVNRDSKWITDEVSMAQKTMLIRLCRYLPISVELSKAIAQDETTRDDLSLVEKETDIFEVASSDVTEVSVQNN